MLALIGHVFNPCPAAGLGPEPLKHPGRPDPPDRRRGVVLRRAQHHRLRHQPRARAHQPLQLTARREHVQPPQGGDHPLADLATQPPALGDLEIGPPARGFSCENTSWLPQTWSWADVTAPSAGRAPPPKPGAQVTAARGRAAGAVPRDRGSHAGRAAHDLDAPAWPAGSADRGRPGRVWPRPRPVQAPASPTAGSL